MNDCVDAAVMGLEQFRDRRRIADVDVVMLVIFDVRDQIVACPRGRRLRSEKLRPQVVVDSDNTGAIFRESLDRFRPNQSGRTGYDDCAH